MPTNIRVFCFNNIIKIILQQLEHLTLKYLMINNNNIKTKNWKSWWQNNKTIFNNCNTKIKKKHEMKFRLFYEKWKYYICDSLHKRYYPKYYKHICQCYNSKVVFLHIQNFIHYSSCRFWYFILNFYLQKYWSCNLLDTLYSSSIKLKTKK